MSQTIFFIISFLVMLIGALGTIIPLLPGIPLIYLGYIIFGLGSHWAHYGATTMIVWGIVTTASVLLDYYAGALGAKKYGASAAGIWGSIIGGILGIIFLGLPGIIFGPFLGAVAGELLSGKSKQQAFKSGWGTLIGFLAGSLFKIIIALVMILTFLWLIIF